MAGKEKAKHSPWHDNKGYNATLEKTIFIYNYIDTKKKEGVS